MASEQAFRAFPQVSEHPALGLITRLSRVSSSVAFDAPSDVSVHDEQITNLRGVDSARVNNSSSAWCPSGVRQTTQNDQQRPEWTVGEISCLVRVSCRLASDLKTSFCFHTAEVTGPIPAAPTIEIPYRD
jgi:hypothetical protein